ncbi:major facilitator superfamily domain-containing protein [Zychaea mexicana]|uniref:major facilitator superfamily domain-containing protein n=1 Tax=Zychaea mexicana TaxID=64656 RepID=UPI0022FF37C4|nr:major facilitator superfamily domain-containing protein [Zychaea mexicana]KAI9493681.1 major facilitator superfamily domain-containing protein [Zychaea mexicana]
MSINDIKSNSAPVDDKINNSFNTTSSDIDVKYVSQQHDDSLIVAVAEEEQPPFSAESTTQEIIFGRKQRLFILFMACVATLGAAFPVQIFYPSLIAIEKEFNTTASIVSISIAGYRVVQAFSPTFWGALSDQWGRRPTYMLTMIISAAACAGIALSPNIDTLIAVRLLQGFGGTSIQSIGDGVVSDISVPATRAGYNSIFQMGYKVGSVLGPVLGGIIAQHLSWRWSFWILVIFTSFVFIMIALFIPETLHTLAGGYYNPTPLQWIKRQGQKRSQTKQLEHNSEVVDSAATSKKEMKISWDSERDTAAKSRFMRKPDFRASYRYIRMPDFFLVMLNEGLYFAAQACYMINLPYLLEDYYNLDVQQIGLCYLAQTLGTVAGGLGAGQYLNYMFRRTAANYDGSDKEKNTGRTNKLPLDFPIYKARLQSVWPNAIAAQITTLVYGWCFYLRTPLAIPLLIQFIVAFNVQCMNSATRCLLIDLRPGKGATVAASVGLFRQLSAAIGSIAMYPATKAVGPGWTYTILSVILMISNTVIPVLLKHGVKWRTKRAIQEENNKQ